MNRITKTFSALKSSGRTALMPYLTMGYPEKDSALSLIPALSRAGADLIELGIPFSDPLADGATIQAASQIALENGMSLHLCLEQADCLRKKGITLPFVMMGYYNPIFQFGIEAFAARAADAGVDGVIVPDLPPEESALLHKALRARDICLIFLLAPTSGDARIRMVAQLSDGFIYLVSLVGVTGSRAQVAPELAAFVNRVRQVTDKPLAVGFGISTPQQAAHIAALADGVIVGSALIKAIGDGGTPADAAYTFVKALRDGMDSDVPDRTGDADAS